MDANREGHKNMKRPLTVSLFESLKDGQSKKPSTKSRVCWLLKPYTRPLQPPLFLCPHLEDIPQFTSQMKRVNVAFLMLNRVVCFCTPVDAVSCFINSASCPHTQVLVEYMCVG